MLGLRAADHRAVTAAANRILAYLQGGADRSQPQGPPDAGSPAQLGGAAPGPDGGGPLARVAAYYEAGPDGRSAGRARGAGAALLGLSGSVSTEQLVRGLTGSHPVTGAPLIPPKGSARRRPDHPDGSRWAPSRGPGHELLSLAEAAYLAGVSPARLRLLAANQPRVRFDTPTPTSELDPRVARRLIEVLTRQPLTVALPGAERDFLLAERDPATNGWAVRRAELDRYQNERIIPETVIGFDLVCAAPKSVSLLWAVGDARARADIAEAMDAAADAVIAFLEAHGCYGMVDGANRHGDGLAAVSYVHDTSRSNDAHLHIHNLILNAVRVTVRDDTGKPIADVDGQPRTEWRALDSGALLRNVKTAGYLGAAELRHQLSVRWGIRWSAVRNGTAEIAGFPPDLLRAFATRHDQIAEEFAQLVEAGMPDHPATDDAAQRASRPAKTVLADSAVRAIQAAKLAHLGWTPERILDLISTRRRSVAAVTSELIAELHDTLVGPRGLTERQTTFTARDVHQAVAAWAGDRLTALQVREVADAFVADPRVVACGADRTRTRQDPEPVYTTESLLAAEDHLHALYRQGRTDHGGIATAQLAPGDAVQAVIKLRGQPAAETANATVRLSDEQEQLVSEVLTSGDLIRCVVGPAGTGKTEAMRAAVTAWQTNGFTVLGAANGGAQTEQLAGRLHIDAQVVRSWLTRFDAATDPGTVWAPNTVLVVDEATQVATRDAERLAHWATITGTVIVFVGDPAQLGAVGAGGWFRHIVYADGAPSLTTVYRQAGAEMEPVRAALAGLRSEMPTRIRKAMSRLAADGRIRVYDDPDTLYCQVVDDWYADRHHRLADTTGRSPKPSQMMAAHHREVDDLNSLARRRLIADGTITGPDLTVGERRFAVGDEVVTLTQNGHTLVPEGASRDSYIRTGTVGTIAAVHINPTRPDTQHLEVLFPGRGRVRIDWAYLNHDFGDGRTGGLTHAYAVTADRSQGSTMHAARTVGTDTTSRAAFYVMTSRGQRELTAYLIADRDLSRRADDEQPIPVLRPAGGPFEVVQDQLGRSRNERLASDLDPDASDVHTLRRGRSLAELTAIRRIAEGQGGRSYTLARRAELAEEAAVGARAITRPDAELIGRLGRRPPAGDHRRAWDRAVRAVAVYRARWNASAEAPVSGTKARWAIGERPTAEPSLWAQQRAQAELLVRRWTAGLDTTRRRRFWAVIEHIPRQRAAAGIHALLAAGIRPDEIAAALQQREQGTARAAAAILDHRVANLLAQHNIDPAGYRLPEPLVAAAEWDRGAELLHQAEVHHLATQSVAQLSEERRQVRQILTGSAEGSQVENLRRDIAVARSQLDDLGQRSDHARHQLPVGLHTSRPDRGCVAELEAEVQRWPQPHADQRTRVDALERELDLAEGRATDKASLRERHELLTHALDLRVDQAVTDTVTRAPTYLVDFLGDRPDNPAQAFDWDRRARNVETWRHHTLGLTPSRPAAPPTSPPSDRALGPAPEDATIAAQRARLITDSQATLDFGATL
ncbi:MAG: hypothetical protein NVSMB4_00090 [Acidimicrobiales bacterium]